MEIPTYDTIGRGYARHRRPDPRIARMIDEALGDALSVVNVGAGTGSYEPRDRSVVAVEPSAEMIAQRPRDAAPAVQGSAENLPFDGRSFDAAMAVLTIHHWSDLVAGISEMRRVARGRVVVLTWDPAFDDFWLIRDYFPGILEIDRRIFPSIDQLSSMLDAVEVRKVPVPHDCTDGFLCAYWRRPEAYLDEGVRRAISTFSKIDDVSSGVDRLRDDLASGSWDRRYAELRALGELDLGYRIVVGRAHS